MIPLSHFQTQLVQVSFEGVILLLWGSKNSLSEPFSNHYVICKWFNALSGLLKLCFETKSTKLYLKMLSVKSSDNKLFFLNVFYLIRWLMKVSKKFGKIDILKIWELISLGGVKNHFGKLALKWCICRHEIIFL